MTNRPRHRRPAPLALLSASAAALLVAAPVAAASPAPAADGAQTCSPVEERRPVCEVGGGGVATAAFLDPTVTVRSAESVSVAEQVYVVPFATLDARRAPISLGRESDVQDGVEVVAAPRSDHERRRALAAAGLDPRDGVVTGERVILAHGSAVRGPARLGVAPEPEGAAGSDGHPAAEDGGVFLSFGSLVDGAVLERDTVLSALSRVGPGVVLPSGTVVLPGKDVRTQAEAEDPALGKVRPVTEVDREFNAGVVEVNTGLAREYSALAREDATSVRGINVDPGGNPFNAAPDLPTVESDLCTGPQVREPGYRNRVIGEVCFSDTRERLRAVMGDRVSLRADEGGPFGIGAVEAMGDGGHPPRSRGKPRPDR